MGFHGGLTSLENKASSSIETLTIRNRRSILEYLIHNDIKMPALKSFVLLMDVYMLLEDLAFLFQNTGKIFVLWSFAAMSWLCMAKSNCGVVITIGDP